jgi:class 3 adenylate cyclase
LTTRFGHGVIRAPPISRKGAALLKLSDRIGSLRRLRHQNPITDEKPVERRLAAILAADVVGYSRLMGADEIGTLRALQAHRRELIDPKIAAHRGRIVKTTGDGALVEFPSAVEAVACAISVQRGIALRNEGVAEDNRVIFRIGINVGDIISEAGDIFGDGVNVAARLESLCEPGGLCISRTVRDQVRDKLPVTFDDLGEQQVKNIARPVRLRPHSSSHQGSTGARTERAQRRGRAGSPPLDHSCARGGFSCHRRRCMVDGARAAAGVPSGRTRCGDTGPDWWRARLDCGPAIGSTRCRGR